VKLCDEEGRRKQLTFPLTRATDRAARYTGVSTTLIKTIRQQSKDRDEKGTVSLLHTPGKHWPRPAHRNVTTDAFDMCKSGVSPSRSRLLTRSYSPFIRHPCRWTNHPHRVLKRFIEPKVPSGTPDAVMAQTGTGKKNTPCYEAPYTLARKELLDPRHGTTDKFVCKKKSSPTTHLWRHKGEKDIYRS
jgi:hypothetical protein